MKHFMRQSYFVESFRGVVVDVELCKIHKQLYRYSAVVLRAVSNSLHSFEQVVGLLVVIVRNVHNQIGNHSGLHV